MVHLSKMERKTQGKTTESQMNNHTVPVGMISNVEWSESLVPDYDEESVYYALQISFPTQDGSRYNRGARLILRQFCEELRTKFNTPILLYERTDK